MISTAVTEASAQDATPLGAHAHQGTVGPSVRKVSSGLIQYRRTTCGRPRPQKILQKKKPSDTP